MLVDVFLNCREDESSLRRLFSTLSCCISQLEILRLRLIRVGKVGQHNCGCYFSPSWFICINCSYLKLISQGRNHDLCKFVELPKLRKLVIEYRTRLWKPWYGGCFDKVISLHRGICSKGRFTNLKQHKYYFVKFVIYATSLFYVLMCRIKSVMDEHTLYPSMLIVNLINYFLYVY